MLFVYANNVDITEHVSRNSVRITEQLNNRSNTLWFSVDQYNIGEGAKIEIFSWFKLTQTATSWSSILHFDEDFEFFEKFRLGEEIIVWIKTSNKRKKIIQSIDHSAKTITLTTNLEFEYPQRTKCWKIEFAWITLKNPDEEIWMTGTFSSKLQCVDWSKLFDAESVVETFQNIYSREMFWRIIYEYNEPDEQTDLDLFASSWTESWTARVMISETTDRIQWPNSMKTGVTGSWIAIWTKTISSVDLSTKEHFRIWNKIAEGEGMKVESIKYRVWTDSSNYFEGVSRFVWNDNEDCWNFEAFKFDEIWYVWTPDKSDITRLQIVVETNASIPSWWLIFDHCFATTGWFTLNKTIRWFKKFEDVRVQYKKPTVIVEEICKLQNFFWFIDYERDLNFFANNSKPAPFKITDNSQNFSELSITTDISQLKNRQTVRGGEAVDQSDYIQEESSDGVATSWRLDYKPKDLRVYVSDSPWTGSSFTEYSVGVENLVDESTVDYVFNFNEKTIRKTDWIPVPLNHTFRRVYKPYKPIRVRVKNDNSIAAMKALLWWSWIFDGAVINDFSIRDWNEARLRAKAEVDAYSNPIITANFITEKDWLKAWQVIEITDTARWIVRKEFLIQRISKTSKALDKRTYSVECGSTMFWIIEFFQLLLKRSGWTLIDVSEIVDVIQNIDEVMTLWDSRTTRQTWNQFFVHTRDLPYNYTLDLTEGWTVRDWYVWFSQVF